MSRTAAADIDQAMVAEALFPSAEALISALATDIVERLTRAVDDRGHASFVAAGGGTPAPLYDELSRRTAPWDRITVTLSDERWTAPDSPASNERMVRQRLLRGEAAQARFVAFKTEAATPTEAINDVDQALAALRPPFDVTLVGMGADGHVASLFPHAPELEHALDPAAPRVCAVRREDAAGAADRLSLTRNGLLDSRGLGLLIQGEDKLAVYRRALAGDDIHALPIRMILQQQRTPIGLWWSP